MNAEKRPACRRQPVPTERTISVRDSTPPRANRNVASVRIPRCCCCCCCCCMRPRQPSPEAAPRGPPLRWLCISDRYSRDRVRSSIEHRRLRSRPSPSATKKNQCKNDPPHNRSSPSTDPTASPFSVTLKMLSLDVYLLPASVRIGRSSCRSSWNMIAPGTRR